MIELSPPIQGISKGFPVDKESLVTSGYMNNVRAKDVLEKRFRLGKRPGLDKWCTTQIGAAEQPIVAFCVVASVL